MADTTETFGGAVPASFDAAFEEARAAMLAARERNAEEDEVAAEVPVDNDPREDQGATDASDDSAEPAEESVAGEPADEVELEAADTDADVSESAAADEDTEPVAAEPSEDGTERKPSRRGKKIEALKQENQNLKVDIEQVKADLLKQLQVEQAERQRLESERYQRQAREQQFSQKILEVLGTEQQYQQAMADALSDDLRVSEPAKAVARQLGQNRQVYGQLLQYAENVTGDKVAQLYWDSVRQIPGLDQNIVATASMAEIHKHIFEAGTRQASEASKAEIAALKANHAKELARVKRDLETTRGTARDVGAKAAKAIRTVSPAGGSPVPMSNDDNAWMYDEDAFEAKRAALKAGDFKFFR